MYMILADNDRDMNAEGSLPFEPVDSPAFSTSSTETGDAAAAQSRLILENMEQQMAALKSKYPTSESSYLAAARARSAAKTPSAERGASDQDWHDMAEAKKKALGQEALLDDWESSLPEAGNSESQILMPFLPKSEGDDPEEPKLLLF